MNSTGLRFVIVVSLVACASCNLLSTRDPQQPSQQTSFRTPTAPDVVLQNFQDAINNRDAASYTRCFADSSHGGTAYRFVPAADAQQVYAGKFLSWGVREESAYFLNLKSQVSADAEMNVFLDSTKFESQSSDSSVVESNYTLIANHNISSRPTKVVGRMHLTIKPDPLTQLWAISNWIDIAGGTAEPSWSMLKALFSQ